LAFINIGRCNCGCLHVSMTDVLVENTKGDFNAQWTSASYLQFGQSAEILRTRFIGNGADIGSMDGAATGVVQSQFISRIFTRDHILTCEKRGRAGCHKARKSTRAARAAVAA
jgi:hypothetical protein